MPLFRVSTYGSAEVGKWYTIDPLNQWTTSLQPPFLLMVHGYNNTIDAANRKFLPVSNRFSDCTRIGFYLENSSKYLVAKHKAKRAARSLKEFLIRNFTAVEARQLTIVGHSMGCRVVLDCLTRLATDSNAPVLKPKIVVLWSAAVDDDEVLQGEAYYEGTKLPSRTVIMYSRNDKVLERYYPVGDQALALGWSGPDFTEGPVAPNVEHQDCTHFIDGHSKWWKSDRALRQLGNLLNG